MDAPSLGIMSGAVGALACFAFAPASSSAPPARAGTGGLPFAAVVSVANAGALHVIRPYVVKGQIQNPGSFFLETWNSFSRVVVHRLSSSPQYSGPSPRAPAASVYQYAMNIDGDAATTLRRFSSPDDIEHLRYDVTNAAYFLRPSGGALIVGLGGGRDVQSAILFRA